MVRVVVYLSFQIEYYIDLGRLAGTLTITYYLFKLLKTLQNGVRIKAKIKMLNASRLALSAYTSLQ